MRLTHSWLWRLWKAGKVPDMWLNINCGCVVWQAVKFVLSDFCSSTLIDSDSQHTNMLVPLCASYMLTASANFTSIYNSWYFSSDLSSSLITISLLVYSAYISIFHGATDVSQQAEEEDSGNELLAPVRNRAGEERQINGGNGEPEGRESHE